MKRGGEASKIQEPIEPGARAGHILQLIPSRQEICLVGGYNENGALSDVWKYDLLKREWKKLQSTARKASASPLPRMEFDGCCLGGGGGHIGDGVGTVFTAPIATGTSSFPRIYLFGGMQFDGEQVLILNDLWSLDCTSTETRWTLISEECPCPERAGHVCVAISDDTMLVHGGDCMRPLDDAWVYNSSANSWSEVGTASPKPPARSQHSAVYCPEINSVAVFGGMFQQDGETVHLNDLWLLACTGDIRGWAWSRVTCSTIAPSPRDLPMMHYQDGLGLLIFGGYGLSEGAAEGEADPAEVEQLQSSLRATSLSKEQTNSDDRIEPQERMSAGSDDEGPLLLTYLDDAWALRLGGNVAEATEFFLGDVVEGSEDEEEEDEEEEDEEEEQDGDDAEDAAEQVPSSLEVEDSPPSAAVEADEPRAEDLEQDDESDRVVVIGPPRRGCRLVPLGDGTLFSFGGFDGEAFSSTTEAISILRIVAAIKS